MNPRDQERSMRRRDQQIADAWDRHNDDDISTERLMSMVMDDVGCVRMGILEQQEPEA